MLKAREVKALLIAMLIEPIQALSMRIWEIRLAPSSTTAMFIGWPISIAFFSAASIIRRASASFSMGTPVYRSVGLPALASMLRTAHKIGALVCRADEGLWRGEAD